MDVITTHIGADFDSLASMIAAKRLYPQAELVFPGSQEKSVRNYLAQEFRNIYEFKKIKHIDPSRIRRLIVVDTRQADRLGELAGCLNNPHLAIHLYDHHPNGPEDLHGELEVIRPFGSTTTLFVQLFQERNITPSPDEATLMALGIYEDTGSFLHSSTRPEDLTAAAWLLGHGANLDIVTQFVSRELSVEQINLIGRLQQQAHSYSIRGVNVVVSILTEEEYIDDFALVVQRLMVMENIDVLFALTSMGERTYLIARSRIPEVNVGTVAREFGGGGHASAASATIREMTIAEAEERLVGLLHDHIRPKAVAAEMMSSPAITVTPEVSIEQANRLMTRYNITVLPVVRSNGGQENGPAPLRTPGHDFTDGGGKGDLSQTGCSASGRIHDHRYRQPPGERHAVRCAATDRGKPPAVDSGAAGGKDHRRHHPHRSHRPARQRSRPPSRRVAPRR